MSVSPGDRITVAVTHKVLINGDEAWIKAEANCVVREGEDADTAWSRISGTVSDHVISVIEGQVEPVLKYNSK